MTSLAPQAKFRAFDTNGNPLSGGKLYTYAAGTTTPLATTKDAAGTPNTNPIILDQYGQCDIWLSTASFKFLLKDSADVTQPGWPVDNVQTLEGLIVSSTAGTIKTVATFADLATTSAIIGDVVEIYEHTSGGKVGGGAFNVVSSSGLTNDLGWTVINGAFAFLRKATDLYIEDFGAIPGGIVDCTTAIQAACNYGNSSTGKNKIIKSRGGLFKITGPITANTAGFDIGSAGYGNAVGSDSAIIVSGTGYTAFTYSGQATNFNISLFGNGGTCNALLLSNPFLGKFGKIRVYNFDGFGVKINKMWDSVIDFISIEQCGNATEYAFSINDDGDTTNMSHILRLQVEKSKYKAIYVSPNTLSCLIDNIHSEQATGQVGTYTWVLGGNRCTYNTLRLDANAPSSDASAILTGSHNKYITPLIEGDIIASVEAQAGSSIDIDNPEIQGRLINVAGQVGLINVTGGGINEVVCEPDGFRFDRVGVAHLSIGFANNIPTKGVFSNCEIGELISTSTQSAATFEGGKIQTHNNLLQGVTVLRGVTVNNVGASALSVSYRTLITHGSTITPAVTIDNGSIISYGTTFSSTITQTAGPVASIFDDGSYAIGAVIGLGVPTSGTWGNGARTKNMAPAVGAQKAWIRAGGVWVSEGNL